jgi:hypothetical protein
VLYSTGNKNAINNSDYFVSNQVPIRAFLNCQNNIKIQYYFGIGQKKFGAIGQHLRLMQPNLAIAVKKLDEFILKDFKLINLVALFCLFIFTYFIRIVTVDAHSSIRVKIALLLTLSALSQSDLVTTMIPLREMGIVVRWLALISYFAYIGFSLKYLLGESITHKNEQRLYTVFTISAIMIALITQSRVGFWIAGNIVFASYLLLFSAYCRSKQLFLLSITMFLSCLDFLGYPYAPNGYIVPTLLVVYISLDNAKAFLSYLKINRLLKLSRSHSHTQQGNGRDNQERRQESRYRTQALIKLFQRQFNIGRISIINLSDAESIQLQQ